MGKTTRIVVWALTALSFAYNLLVWGGLALTPTIGQMLRDQATFNSPMAATYMFVGRKSVAGIGRQSDAVEYAAKRFPAAVSDPPASNVAIVEHFLSAQSAFGALNYYGAPLLLVLSLVLHATRQKQIRSFGRTG